MYFKTAVDLLGKMQIRIVHCTTVQLILYECVVSSNIIKSKEKFKENVANNKDLDKFQVTIKNWRVQNQTLRTTRNLQNKKSQQTSGTHMFVFLDFCTYSLCFVFIVH